MTDDRAGLPRSGSRRGTRGCDDHELARRGRRHVELNQTLCTVETNKAEVEIPSPYAGLITELGGGEGETLNVGAVLVRIATAADTGTKRRPVLVGYGADDEMDDSRRSARPASNVRVRSRQYESWPRS